MPEPREERCYRICRTQTRFDLPGTQFEFEVDAGDYNRQTFNSNKIEYAQIMKNICGTILKFLLLPFKLFINKPCVKLCQAQRAA